YDEVDRAALLLQHLHRLDAVLRLDHGVAARAQATRVERAQALLVLDQEDGALPREIGAGLGFRGRSILRHGPRSAACRPRLDLPIGLGAMPWQEDVERGALARLGIDIDEAAGLLDDAVDGGEPEARALADLLGRKERLEDLVADVGGNAGAGI